MACTKWDQYGILFRAGELSEQEAEEFLLHSEECSDCGEALAEYDRIMDAVHKSENYSYPSEACDDRIRRALNAQAGKLKKTSVFRLPGFLLMPMVRVSFGALLLVSGYFLGVNISNSGGDMGSSLVADYSDEIDTASTIPFREGDSRGIITVDVEE